MKKTLTIRHRQGLLILLSAALILSCGCPLLPCFDSGNLITLATGYARQLDPDVIVFSVSGVNGDRLYTDGTQTTSYSFRAIDPAAGDTIYTLDYDLMSWTTGTSSFPTLGVAYHDLREVTMTEARARRLLADAGYDDDFHGWSLYRPLYPGATAIYTFNYGDQAVMIDTETEAVSVTTPAAEGPPLAGAPSDDAVSIPMIAAADAQIKETAATAFIIWAGGRDGDGNSLNAAADTNVWDFVAISLDNGDAPAWRLSYDGTWTVEALAEPPFGILFQDLYANLGMDVVEAWTLAVDAGYNPPFSTWEVFQPLNPSVENIIYVFPASVGFVIVDSVTGEVHVEDYQ